MLADSDEQVFEFLNIVDLATRFSICFLVPSRRPDDVLSVIEMVWINWRGPMNHLISDMEGEFEGALGEFWKPMEFDNNFTASEAPWQNGLVERNLARPTGSSVEDTSCLGRFFWTRSRAENWHHSRSLA